MISKYYKKAISQTKPNSPKSGKKIKARGKKGNLTRKVSTRRISISDYDTPTAISQSRELSKFPSQASQKRSKYIN